jgi:hypothetical protein
VSRVEQRMQASTNLETSMFPSAGPVPVRPEEFTAEWLTSCLRHSGALSNDARVIAFEQKRIGVGHGFAGEIMRISLRYDRAEQAAPATLVGKFASEHAPTREMMATIGAFEREVRFYRELAPHVGVGTPRCYFAHYNHERQRFCLLLEDMAPAAPADRAAGLSLEQAEVVLTQLATLHAHWWGRVQELEWLKLTPELLFRVRDRYLASLPTFLARFAETYPKMASVASMIGILFQGDEFVGEVSQGPFTLAHNDMHIDNIFLPTAAGGRFALIDWQSVSASRHGITDVTRILSFGMQPAQRRKHDMALLRHYHDALVRAGVRGYSFRTLKRRYRQELVAMVIISVLAFDTLDFQTVDDDTLAMMGTRVESAISDERLVYVLRPFMLIYGIRRWWRRLFAGGSRQIGPGA